MANDPNYSAALKWLQDVAAEGPNTGVVNSGVLAGYAGLLLAEIERLERGKGTYVCAFMGCGETMEPPRCPVHGVE